ncbi:hypothetical protein L2E82_12363 [Cichorium intybus]|uniref:Uncharacterized protein n=1 Tax=Cichorium intybus TaxID=13427 RepID=A0ACB9GH49_CICIN|nr:hypothetical protein L2E82_12363 [Cichorium intybus]
MRIAHLDKPKHATTHQKSGKQRQGERGKAENLEQIPHLDTPRSAFVHRRLSVTLLAAVYSTVSGDSFACKSIDKRLLADPTDRECLQKEPKILHILGGNPHIVQIYRLY